MQYFEPRGLSSLSSLRTLKFGLEDLSLPVEDLVLSVVQLSSLGTNGYCEEEEYVAFRRMFASAQLSGLVELDLHGTVCLADLAHRDTVCVADLAALRQLTALSCLGVLFPDAASGVTLPALRHLNCINFKVNESAVPRAVALTLPALENLQFDDIPTSTGFWPQGHFLPKMTTLGASWFFALPLAMVKPVSRSKSWSCLSRGNVRIKFSSRSVYLRLRILEANLQKLTIR